MSEALTLVHLLPAFSILMILHYVMLIPFAVMASLILVMCFLEFKHGYFTSVLFNYNKACLDISLNP